MYIKPIGVNLVLKEDRKPIVFLVSGDSAILQTRAFLPNGGPATPTNSIIKFVLSESRFNINNLWEGTWATGIQEVTSGQPGLIKIQIPKTVTDTLRRGVYVFSLQITDTATNQTHTPVFGSLLVEYEPTSPEKNIPYKSGPEYDPD